MSDHLNGWLGRQDSNLRMPGSKPGALPLGDAPSYQIAFAMNIFFPYLGDKAS